MSKLQKFGDDEHVRWLKERAAQEMYEALKKCYLLPRPWLDGGVTWPDWNNAMEDVQAALAKAEGRS